MPAFPDTRWTLIVAAADGQSPAASRALEELCHAYWYPVYAFIRRFGNSPEDAEDLTQSFFAYFLERRNFADADPTRGRFRSFLLASVKRFLSDQADRRSAAKRGGTIAGLDLEEAEKQYARAFADHETPERLYEMAWASTLMLRVNDNLRTALQREGRGDQFDQLRRFLPGSDQDISYSDAAGQLRMSEGALKVAVHRLRRRYREMFRIEIAQVVSDPALIDDEVRRLLEVFRG
jgi:RNA polymerase sigma-70 factor (ECF subfamily)